MGSGRVVTGVATSQVSSANSTVVVAVKGVVGTSSAGVTEATSGAVASKS